MKCRKCGIDTWVGVETILCDECKKKSVKMVDADKQTIAEIKKRHEITERLAIDIYPDNDNRLKNNATKRHSDRAMLLKIIESLSDKLQSQEKEIEILRSVIKIGDETDLIPMDNRTVLGYNYARKKLAEFDEKKAKEQGK